LPAEGSQVIKSDIKMQSTAALIRAAIAEVAKQI
jgi:hypothetical protein